MGALNSGEVGSDGMQMYGRNEYMRSSKKEAYRLDFHGKEVDLFDYYSNLDNSQKLNKSGSQSRGVSQLGSRNQSNINSFMGSRMETRNTSTVKKKGTDFNGKVKTPAKSPAK